MEIKVLKNVLIKNNAIGNDNRLLFYKHNIFTLNIMSSPGAGKTTLLENSLEYLNNKYKTAVIEGDLYTSRDAERLAPYNIPIVQINTDGGCHLDARMIHGALQSLDLNKINLLVIENVGNLVCPASFDLGEHIKVLVYSITEGADKPKKYASMFSNVDAVLVNKIDLASICNIDLEQVCNEIREINPKGELFKIAANNRNTLHEWLSWLDKKAEEIITQGNKK
ncbi:MAG: hydrogenase nickel incorporation protein HypB [Oligoflexia bacterium]|nr:hydrogenase nickel incorporation protein HypB [Oligoflexia bacterium]